MAIPIRRDSCKKCQTSEIIDFSSLGQIIMIMIVDDDRTERRESGNGREKESAEKTTDACSLIKQESRHRFVRLWTLYFNLVDEPWKRKSLAAVFPNFSHM